MEETVVPKRPREETQVEEDVDCEEYSKRNKPYNHILSLLESEEEVPTEDLSPLITTLQQEITCASNNSDTLLNPPQKNGQDNLSTSTITTTTTSLEDCSTSSTTFSATHSDGILKEDEKNDKERVMRHLLEASDDELGIPNRGDGLVDFGEDGFNCGDRFSSLCDGLWPWELEDETASYYTLLQSELFL